MKNIHLIPTDKPSRFFLNKVNGKLLLDNDTYCNLIKILPSGNYQNIYITSNEEIKCKDYVLSDNSIGALYLDGEINTASMLSKEQWKKVVLTTDKDLIKVGVQGIDNEFLEWFVMNPSCEEVEIIKQHQYHSSKEFYIDADYVNCSKEQYESIKEEIPNCSLRILYKIIIPNEEPKQDWFCPKCDSYVSSESVTFEETHQTCNTGVVIKEPKQETLEEAIKREYEARKFDSVFPFDPQSFKLGVKWEAKRRYSEEDMIEFALFLEIHLPMKPRKTHHQLLEQFKTK